MSSKLGKSCTPRALSASRGSEQAALDPSTGARSVVVVGRPLGQAFRHFAQFREIGDRLVSHLGQRLGVEVVFLHGITELGNDELRDLFALSADFEEVITNGSPVMLVRKDYASEVGA